MDLAITCNEIVFKGAPSSCSGTVAMKPVRVFLYPYCEASEGNNHPEKFTVTPQVNFRYRLG